MGVISVDADKPETICSEEQFQELARKLSCQSSERYKEGIDNGEKEPDIQEKIRYDIKETTIDALFECFLSQNSSQKEVLENNKGKFKRKLKQKSPHLTLPALTDFYAVSPKLRACVSAGGALYGGLLFGLIFRFFLGEGLSGALLGACLFTWFFTFAAEDIDMRDQLGKIVKYVAAMMLVKFIIDKIIPKLPTLGKVSIPRGKKNSLAPLLIVIFPWLIIKIQREGFEERRCQYMLNNIYLNWLSGAESTAGIIVDQILSEDRKETPCSEDDEEKRKARTLSKNLDKMAERLLSWNIETDEDRILLIKDLKTMVAAMGYSLQENGKSPSGDNTSASPLLWKKDLEEKYETFGVINEGDEYDVWKEFFEKEGVVVKKGVVRKRRGAN